MPDVSRPQTYRNLLEVQLELQLPTFYLLVDYLVRRQKDTDSRKVLVNYGYLGNGRLRRGGTTCFPDVSSGGANSRLALHWAALISL